MKRFMLCGLLSTLLVGWTALAFAEGLPWQKDTAAPGDKKPDTPVTEGEKPPAETAKPAVDLEKELPPLVFDRAIKPILAALAQATKEEGLYDKEMEKPADKRVMKKAIGFREGAAKAYIMASLKAKQAVNIVQEPAQKEAIVAQYEKPSRDKAVEIYLWLADMYAQEHDIRTAVAYYNKVLQIDPENATAKGQIEKIKKDVAQAAADQKAGTGTPGGGAAGTTGLDFTGKNQTDPVKDAKRPDQQKTDWKRVGGLQ